MTVRTNESRTRKVVFLLIESSRAYGRGCLRGVARYTRAHDDWDCLHIERGLEEPLPEWTKDFKPDGVIARIETRAMLEALRDLNVPVVDLRSRFEEEGFARIDTDGAAVSHLIADHFLERGFRRFGFCGYPGIDFSDDRCQAFVEYLGGKGFEVDVYNGGPEAQRGSLTDTLRAESVGVFDEQAIGNWIDKLARPTAIMACNDVRGRQVLHGCASRDVRVPTSVAVVGVDNDEIVCDFARPVLSSVQPDVEAIGYLGAELLSAMIDGGTPPASTRLIPPRSLVTRLSSEVLAIEDPTLAEAVSIIREDACSGLNVEELTQKLAVSRTTLERRFQRFFGCSPKEEIIRCRLQRVCQLLTDTDHSVATIATKCGFKTPPHLSVVFSRQLGVTPGKYRSQMRQGEDDRDSLANFEESTPLLNAHQRRKGSSAGNGNGTSN